MTERIDIEEYSLFKSIGSFRAKIILILFYLLLLGVFYYDLVLPEVLYIHVMAHDNFIFLDGAYRVWSGQIPHVDFISALGFFNYYGPGLIMGFGLDATQSFVLYNYLWLVFILSLSLYVCMTRLSISISLIFLLYMSVLVGAPMNIAEAGTEVTYAMFYNRIGWGALILMVLFMVRPFSYNAIRSNIEAGVVGFIWLLLLYTKITYFVVAPLVVLSGILISSVNITFIIRSALVFFVGVLIVELYFPGINFQYINDLLMTVNANDGKRVAWGINVFLDVFYVFMFLCFYVFLRRRCFSYSQDLVVLVIFFLSVFIAWNNFQRGGMPTLVSLLILVHSWVSVDKTLFIRYKGVLFLFLLMLMGPDIYIRLQAIERHERIPRVHEAESLQGCLSGIYIRDVEASKVPLMNIDEGGIIKMTLEEFHGFSSLASNEWDIYQSQYAYMVSQGCVAINSVVSEYGKRPLVNFDFSNPFSMLLNLPPVYGDYAWYHSGRNISANSYLAPEKFLAGAGYISIPKFPGNIHSRNLLMFISRDYLDEYFDLIYDGVLWEVYVRK